MHEKPAPGKKKQNNSGETTKDKGGNITQKEAPDTTEQPPPFDPVTLCCLGEDEEHWKRKEEIDKINHERNHPLARSPYSHHNDRGLQIYPEPRRYGFRAGEKNK